MVPLKEFMMNPDEFLKNETTKKLLWEAVACNCVGDTKEAGNATELAMIKFVDRCGVDYKAIRAKYLPAKENQDQLKRFPFDSARKRMSTIMDIPQEEVSSTEHGYGRRLHVKGASEIILGTCVNYLDESGNKVLLEDGMVQQLKK